MLKEIYEQPKVSRDVLYERISNDNDYLKLENINIDISKYDKLYFVGCGTAYHAALIGKYLIEKIVRIPISAEVASEFRYRDPIIDEKTLVIAVSQSGETADTLASLRIAKSMGSTVMGIVNVVGSSIAREVDLVVYTNAKTEIAVATTKGYMMQVYVLGLIAIATISINKLFPAKKDK
jgi:glucosamine--fructose-6-phosphate aminotransferase (isomerizing)